MLFTIEIDSKYSKKIMEEILANILADDEVFSNAVITKASKNNKCKYDDCDYENCPWYVYGKLHEKTEREDYIPRYPPKPCEPCPDLPYPFDKPTYIPPYRLTWELLNISDED